ncbi:MAG TPA: glycine cleavage system protein GcvH [Acidiferrobacter sp.]|nr:glycine cleavage system protein GcvH [Acidiferrobacter sp.]
MGKVPADLRYTKSHEWVRETDQGFVVGITDHAQDLMGDMVFVELPKVGTRIVAGKECAVVESVKAASDVYAPVSGEVTEVNQALTETPETLNSDPYGDGWLFKVRSTDKSLLKSMLDASAYKALLAAEG